MRYMLNPLPYFNFKATPKMYSPLKKLFFLATALCGFGLNAQILINFGTEAGAFNTSNDTEQNYGFASGNDTSDRMITAAANFAQNNWALSSPIDLSSFVNGTGIFIHGDMTSTGSGGLRMYLYDTTSGVAAFSGISDFSTLSTGLVAADAGLSASDAFGNSGTGSFDWTSVNKIGFRMQASETANISFDFVGGVTAVPEPSTYALIAGALAFVGLLLRRRLMR